MVNELLEKLKQAAGSGPVPTVKTWRVSSRVLKFPVIRTSFFLEVVLKFSNDGDGDGSK